MKKFINILKNNWVYIFVFILIMVLVFLSPLTGDDWGWSRNIKGLWNSFMFGVNNWKDYNGRVLGHALVSLMANYNLFKLLIISFTFTFIVYFLSKFAFKKNGKKNLSILILSLLLILCMPIGMLREIFLWMSGFSNFGIPAISMLIYLYIIRETFNKQEIFKENNYKIVICFLCGFMMNLFSEHSAIFSVILGVVIILTNLFLTKKTYKSQCFFLMGSILGCSLMFISPSYWGIMPRLNDANFFYNMNFIEKVFYNLQYSTWINDMVFNNFILNFALSCIFFLGTIFNKDKINKICSSILLMMTTFIFFSIDFLHILIFNNFILKVFLCFLYFVLIFILIYRLFYKKDFNFFIKISLLFVLSFVAASPLLAAYGFGPRCFLNSYLLLSLFSVLLFYKLDIKIPKIFDLGMLLGIVLISGLLLYGELSNYKILKIREHEINNVLKNGSNLLELPHYKYPVLIHNFGVPWENKYHNDVFRMYYGLSSSINIYFIDYESYFEKY